MLLILGAGYIGAAVAALAKMMIVKARVRRDGALAQLPAEELVPGDIVDIEAGDLVLYQLGALSAIAKTEGVRLRHVKVHGALYNMAARDRALADAIAAAVIFVTIPPVPRLAAPGRATVTAARSSGASTSGTSRAPGRRGSPS